MPQLESCPQLECTTQFAPRQVNPLLFSPLVDKFKSYSYVFILWLVSLCKGKNWRLEFYSKLMRTMTNSFATYDLILWCPDSPTLTNLLHGSTLKPPLGQKLFHGRATITFWAPRWVRYHGMEWESRTMECVCLVSGPVAMVLVRMDRLGWVSGITSQWKLGGTVK